MQDYRVGGSSGDARGLGAVYVPGVGVRRLWEGETVCIIGGGPSLTAQDCETARQAQARLLGINNAYQIAPLDLLYACDFNWWDKHPEARDLPILKVTQDARVPERWPGIDRVPSENAPGLSLDPLRIHQGQNGGYQALNLAVLLGARRILLLGYDMQQTGGKSHWHGDHRQGLNNPPDPLMRDWVENFASTLPSLERAGVEVINCTRETALTCYPRRTIDNAV